MNSFHSKTHKKNLLLKGLIAFAASCSLVSYMPGAMATDFNPDNATPPKGYSAICSYKQACAVSKPSLVAFGSHGQYAYKLMKGAFECSERSFNRKPQAPHAATCSITKPRQSHKKASASSVAVLTTGSYAILSRHSGKALEVAADGTIKQAPYTRSATQHFTLSQRPDGYFTISPTDGDALGVKDWQTIDGASIDINPAADSWNQHWQIDDSELGFFAIKSRFSGKSLDLFGLNTNNSADIRLWTYWGGKNQQWQLVPVSEDGSTKLSF